MSPLVRDGRKAEVAAAEFPATFADEEDVEQPHGGKTRMDGRVRKKNGE